MAELAVDAFGRLAEVMRAEMAAAEKGTRGYMVAMARGYLRFALRNIGLFQLMFRLQEANHNDERVRDAGAVAFALAAEAVSAFHQVADLSADPEVAPTRGRPLGHGARPRRPRHRQPVRPAGRGPRQLEAVLELVVGQPALSPRVSRSILAVTPFAG